jgi:hypothetical protein
VAYRCTKFPSCSYSDEQSPSCIFAVAFVQRTVICLCCQIFRDHFNINENLAENWVCVLVVRGKTASELPQCECFTLVGMLHKWAQFSFGDLYPDQFGSGSFLVESWSLKELKWFSALQSNWNPSCSKIRRVWVPDFTCTAFKQKKRFANFSLYLF